MHYRNIWHFIRYIYTDQIDLNKDNLMQVYVLARKYGFQSLQEKALKKTKSLIDNDTVLSLLTSAIAQRVDDVSELCLTLIQRNTDVLVKTGHFLDIPLAVLDRLLSVDYLSIRETDLILACLNWAEKKVKEVGGTRSQPRMRDELGQCLYKLNYHKMDPRSFQKHIVKKKLLPEMTAFRILQHILSDDSEGAALPPELSCQRVEKNFHMLHVAATSRADINNIELDFRWKCEGVTITTSTPVEMSSLILLFMLEKQHSPDATLDHLQISRDAVCVDGQPRCLLVKSLTNKDDGCTKINNERVVKANGQMVRVEFDPLVRIESKVVLSFDIKSSIKIRPFPFGAESLSDKHATVKISTPNNRPIPLSSGSFSIPKN